MKPIGPDMICTKPWKVSRRQAPGFPGIEIPDVKVGDRIGVETVDFAREIARVHFGGMLRTAVFLEDLVEHTRVAEPEEIKKEVKRCPRCGMIESPTDGRWRQPPPCFTPRKGVTLRRRSLPGVRRVSEAPQLRDYLKRLLPPDDFARIETEARLLVRRSSVQHDPLYSCAIALASAVLNDNARSTAELTRKTVERLMPSNKT